MTSTGFGDISPAIWYSQACTNAQMLMGTMYHVGVFGLTLAHFRTFQKLTAEETARQAELRAAEGKSVVAAVMDFVESLNIADRMRKVHPVFDKIRHFCLQHLVLVSVTFQAIITSLLFIIPDPFVALSPSDGAAYNVKVIIITIMVLLQSLLFAAVLFISFRLVKSINNKELSANFLIQSYIATALLFGGIYFILYAATPHHQFSRNNEFDMSVFEVLYVFVHFSLTVMTTTGFGDIYARGVIARMFVLVEMLVSILYNAVIIGLGTSQLIDMQAGKAEEEFSKMRSEREQSLTSSRDEQYDGASISLPPLDARQLNLSENPFESSENHSLEMSKLNSDEEQDLSLSSNDYHDEDDDDAYYSETDNE